MAEQIAQKDYEIAQKAMGDPSAPAAVKEYAKTVIDAYEAPRAEKVAGTLEKYGQPDQTEAKVSGALNKSYAGPPTREPLSGMEKAIGGFAHLADSATAGASSEAGRNAQYFASDESVSRPPQDTPEEAANAREDFNRIYEGTPPGIAIPMGIAGYFSPGGAGGAEINLGRAVTRGVVPTAVRGAIDTARGLGGRLVRSAVGAGEGLYALGADTLARTGVKTAGGDPNYPPGELPSTAANDLGEMFNPAAGPFGAIPPAAVAAATGVVAPALGRWGKKASDKFTRNNRPIQTIREGGGQSTTFGGDIVGGLDLPPKVEAMADMGSPKVEPQQEVARQLEAKGSQRLYDRAQQAGEAHRAQDEAFFESPEGQKQVPYEQTGNKLLELLSEYAPNGGRAGPIVEALGGSEKKLLQRAAASTFDGMLVPNDQVRQYTRHTPAGLRDTQMAPESAGDVRAPQTSQPRIWTLEEARLYGQPVNKMIFNELDNLKTQAAQAGELSGVQSQEVAKAVQAEDSANKAVVAEVLAAIPRARVALVKPTPPDMAKTGASLESSQETFNTDTDAALEAWQDPKVEAAIENLKDAHNARVMAENIAARGSDVAMGAESDVANFDPANYKVVATVRTGNAQGVVKQLKVLRDVIRSRTTGQLKPSGQLQGVEGALMQDREDFEGLTDLKDAQHARLTQMENQRLAMGYPRDLPGRSPADMDFNQRQAAQGIVAKHGVTGALIPEQVEALQGLYGNEGSLRDLATFNAAQTLAGADQPLGSIGQVRAGRLQPGVRANVPALRLRMDPFINMIGAESPYAPGARGGILGAPFNMRSGLQAPAAAQASKKQESAGLTPLDAELLFQFSQQVSPK